MKKYVLMLLLTGLVSVSSADVIGDFEGTLDGWAGSDGVTLAAGSTGVTLNAGALTATPDAGFSWGIKTNDTAKAAGLAGTTGHMLYADVTFITAEWSTTGNLQDVYVGFAQIAMQGNGPSGSMGWTEFKASSDTGNPGYPGFWTPYEPWYGETQTRTIGFDLSVDKDGNPVDLYSVFGGGAWWFELIFSTNIGSNDGGVVAPGNYYIDNIRLESIPEPASLALLGFGALILRRRK